jgi:membrane protein YdbS with pleckstrin-like domain
MGDVALSYMHAHHNWLPGAWFFVVLFGMIVPIYLVPRPNSKRSDPAVQ